MSKSLKIGKSKGGNFEDEKQKEDNGKCNV
jgi:hypothetical protein